MISNFNDISDIKQEITKTILVDDYKKEYRVQRDLDKVTLKIIQNLRFQHICKEDTIIYFFKDFTTSCYN